MLVQGNTIVLFDFHNAQRGASYFDLAMLNISLYCSLTFPPSSPEAIHTSDRDLLKGILRQGFNAETIKSMKLAELYVALREILTSAKALCTENAPAIRLITILKIRRFKKAIKEVILPKLTT